MARKTAVLVNVKIEDVPMKFYAVHVTCLDDVDVNELVSAPITYVDGRNNNFQSPPLEMRHL